MNVLIACEESQAVCKEFRKLGHRAFSCDLQECSGGHPEWHIHGDVVPVINGKCEFQTQDTHTHTQADAWDLLIAHPPCTYLTKAGASRVFRQEYREEPAYGLFQMVNVERIKQGIVARDLFLSFLYADCPRIAVENPFPMAVFMLPKPTQIIQPYLFGDPYTKKTCLWLKGLPPLVSTEYEFDYHPFINGGGGRLERDNYKGQQFASGGVDRSKTFPGIARAMAEQWGNGIRPQYNTSTKGQLEFL